MLENLEPAQLEMMRNMLLAMDPPRHVDYRRPIAPRFKARVIASMEEPDPRDLPRDHGRGRGRRATSSSCTTSRPRCRRG